jgi:hypothetical protein
VSYGDLSPTEAALTATFGQVAEKPPFCEKSIFHTPGQMQVGLHQLPILRTDCALHGNFSLRGKF